MARHRVCKVSELPPGSRKIVEIAGRSIGVFNIRGSFYAIRNRCPHQAAPLCRGIITGTTRPSQPGTYVWEKDGEVIRCPWHGWEFDITTGRSVFNPHKMRVKRYEVFVETDLAGIEAEAVETYPVDVVAGNVVLIA